ncbi:MAG: hypothetical protein ACKO10_00775 [Betaproteobacteria bacterium]
MRFSGLSLFFLSALIGSKVMAEPWAAGGGYFQSVDSERFSSRRISAEMMNNYQHLDHRTGLRYIDHQFSQTDWRRSGQQLRLVARNIDRKTIDGWNAELGWLQQSNHDLLTVDASYRHTFAGGPALEMFANRDVVETRAALDRGVYFNFVGASVDVPVNDHLTLVGLAGQQAFSDDNQRRHLRARVIWQPSLDLGLTLQLRYRWFDNSKLDVGRAYFNPERYQEGMLAVGWRQRMGDWRHGLTAGLGTQQIAAEPFTPTQLLEFSSETQAKRYALRLRAGYSRAAGAAATNDPDYWYRYVMGELVLPF